MEFAEVLRRRRMVRRYDKTLPVGRGDLDALVRAGLRAPSAGYAQGTRFLVLDDPRSVDRYWSVTATSAEQDAWLAGMHTAPALIVVYSDRSSYEQRYSAADKSSTHAAHDLDSRWPVPYWHVDAGMAAMLVQLAAVDRGLAYCFFAVPTERVDALAAAFGVPTHWAPVGVISVGHADAGVPRRDLATRRRPVHDLVFYGRADAGHAG